jgi:hypothetical protein
LLRKRDLLFNSEQSNPKDQQLSLHRHPAFFGSITDVIRDCCGSCPPPFTEAERAIAAKITEKFVSGGIQFVKDNPGRQSIGSFHPITDLNWTDMAYVH